MKTPKVDDAWVKVFPEDAGLKGEKIPMHHVQDQLPAYPPKNELNNAFHTARAYEASVACGEEAASKETGLQVEAFWDVVSAWGG